ncbi:MAG: very short patch repair endonuclease [Planctomycetes bacterium]|nr:very short patch repair endonuclease [Planctomycetota bacterium]
MARIGSRATSPERFVARLLRQRRFRPKQNVESLAGKPDFVFPHRRKIIFVHGCFWHRHTCRRGQSFPSTNITFWRAKLKRNASRDKRVHRKLRKLGWRIMTIWECQTKNADRLSRALVRFLYA